MMDINKPASHIQHGTFAKGVLKTEGTIRIDGTLEGGVIAKNCVVVGRQGLLNGSIQTKDAKIDGTVRGRINANHSVYLSPTGDIDCDVSAANLIVEPGAIIKGHFNITPNHSIIETVEPFDSTWNDRLVFKDISISILIPDAKQVRLVGSFCDWDYSQTIPLQQSDDGLWSVQLELKPGSYEYLLLVDGHSQIDPTNPRKVTNSFGGHNSVLIVPQN